jgi:hypothetical protein
VDKKVVRHAAAEAEMAAQRIKAQKMIAKRFLVRRPKPPDLHGG